MNSYTYTVPRPHVTRTGIAIGCAYTGPRRLDAHEVFWQLVLLGIRPSTNPFKEPK